jgi:hypothetical protein
MAKSKENKDMLERGQKIRAGLIISKYLRAILQEKTEILDVEVSPDKIEHRVVSKAERIARDMVREAMTSSDAKTKLEYRKLVIERADGKTGIVDDALGKDRDTIPDKVSEMNKRRLNRFANEAAEE